MYNDYYFKIAFCEMNFDINVQNNLSLVITLFFLT